jgi:hypothetical protein
MLPLLILLLLVAVATGCGSSETSRRGDVRPPVRPAAVVAGPRATAELPASAVAAMHLDRARARRIATVHGRGVWIAPTETGGTCLVDTAADAVGGACGPTLFGAHKLAFTEASDGGPPPRPVTLLRLSGAAAPDVGSVVVELSDGSRAVLVPNDDGAFVYEEPSSQLAAGVAPLALVARDGEARPVDEVDLPRAPFTRQAPFSASPSDRSIAPFG